MIDTSPRSIWEMRFLVTPIRPAARAALRRALEAGEPVGEIIDAFIVPLAERAVPEWRTTLDALLSLPEIGARHLKRGRLSAPDGSASPVICGHDAVSCQSLALRAALPASSAVRSCYQPAATKD
jgi:hypothetical protein